MYYVEVLVADATYHGTEALTYSIDQLLAEGTVVLVPVRAKEVLGIVTTTVRRPQFKTKPVLYVPDLPPLPPQSLQLLSWMQIFYPAPLGSITQHFLPRHLPKKLPPAEMPQESPPLPPNRLPKLTSDQQNVMHAIAAPGMYLLHGETGTGKTRVYIELARRTLATGRSVIILTPEISLTSQLTHNFEQVFGSRVFTFHSQLTEATRHKLWTKLLRSTRPVIVVGARSALFTPLPDIGLIVVDEAHENAYKQDQAPYYHASRVAGKLAALHQAILVIGSATPLVEDYYLAQQKKRPILRMTQTATAAAGGVPVPTTVVDLRDRAQFSKTPRIADRLLAAIDQTLGRQEQVLLFLNRRGTARLVFCENCGWQAMCPHCDIPLVYHGDLHSMRCHSCAYAQSPVGSCPACHNPSVVFRAIGTKAITEEIQKLFPAAHVQRFDTDNTKAERLEQHYHAIREGTVDILIGTQLLAKGLDLPKLGLVGVLLADSSLYFPDFSANERTYQLLSQVLGRVGRGHRQGQAFIQTYNPKTPVLKAVLQKNWETFYDQELAERRQFMFPPFCYLLQLTCRRSSEAAAQRAAEVCKAHLQGLGLPIRIEGPSPAFRERAQGKYQWQLIVKAKHRAHLLDVIRNLPANWTHNIDPSNLL